MPNFVQLYRSTDASAPVLSGQVGKMNDLLQAVLVDGYTTAAVTSITEASTTYTVTLTTANATLNTNNYVTIAGCTGGFTALNGVWKITVTSSTIFTFVGPGGLGTPATGTITYRKAPLAWTNAFATAGNIATFRGQSVTGRTTQHYLRVDDNGTLATPSYRECQVRGYVTMSDKDTGTEPFPTVALEANGNIWRKSTTLDATARPWVLVGDGATFYFVSNSDNSLTAGRHLCGFGGHLTDIVGDAYHSFISGARTSNVASPTLGNGSLGTVTALYGTTIYVSAYAPRSYTQLGTALAISGGTPVGANATPAVLSGIAINPLPYPHDPDGGLYVYSVLCTQAGQAIRGRFPGLYGHYHTSHPGAEGDQITTVAGLTGVTLRFVSITSVAVAGMALFDEFGPW
jgi:hypothetical protein